MQRCVAASHQPRCKEDEDVAWGSHVFDELQQPWDAALCCCEPSAAVQRGRGRCKCSRSCSSAGMQRCITASNQPWCSAVEDFGWGLHMFKELQQPWDVVLCCCKQSAVVQRGLCTGFARLTSCSSAGTQRCVTASDQPRCSNNEDVVQGLHVLEELQQPWDAALRCCKPSAIVQRVQGHRTGCCTCWRSRSSAGMRHCLTASDQLLCNKDIAQGLHVLEELQQCWDAVLCCCTRSAVVQQGQGCSTGLALVQGAAAALGCNIMSLQVISYSATRTRPLYGTLHVLEELLHHWDAPLHCCK
ncbi:uncharacterized protein LOC115338503 isoform X3 [Aquila chrysaetos chrysaetos]|uniref:uncharacterized protein LOC115338503 isoform X3 n=1 Tax=Aquila chrysaetos chrysaetos TaxID=223781 RepID=UPI00117664A3|nr:uncharacterized protein LOC115338503 isoform X3 [Aquila chrysaetos chrysaetos]